MVLDELSVIKYERHNLLTQLLELHRRDQDDEIDFNTVSIS